MEAQIADARQGDRFAGYVTATTLVSSALHFLGYLP
jgi:hypothetical protein